MTKVFVSGSMRIKRLDENVLGRLGNIIAQDFWIIVGDASGVDSSIQKYLRDQQVDSVLVYCTGGLPRNNLGQWKTKAVRTTNKPGTREYYTAKDVEMANDCDYGLMIWDAKSTGTLKNTIELLKRKKKSVVYINKAKQFVRVREPKDLECLLGYMSRTSFEKANSKLGIRNNFGSIGNEQKKLFA